MNMTKFDDFKFENCKVKWKEEKLKSDEEYQELQATIRRLDDKIRTQNQDNIKLPKGIIFKRCPCCNNKIEKSILLRVKFGDYIVYNCKNCKYHIIIYRSCI